MLETLRQYCLESLEQTGEADLVRARHRDWCISLVAGVPPEAHDEEQVARLQPELDNLHAALRWAIETSQVQEAARLALGMAFHWLLGGHFAEGRTILTTVLDLTPSGEGLAELAHVGNWACVMAFNQGDYREAETAGGGVPANSSDAADDYAALFAENILGWVSFLRGDVALAAKAIQRSHAALARTQSPLAYVARNQLAFISVELGERRSRARAHRLGRG